MSTLVAPKLPEPQESLADYVKRLRSNLGLSRQVAAAKAGIHPQSLGKIERGQTQTLNQRTLTGLAHALQIPADYLDAVSKDNLNPLGPTLKFCTTCWTPGTPLDPIWTNARSKYCFACGNQLQNCCPHCAQPFVSMQFRFCPFCGKSYKSEEPNA